MERDKEQVLCFPTAAYFNPDQTHWIVPVHVWLFRRKEKSRKRAMLLRLFRRVLRLPKQATQNPYFQCRVRAFLVQNLKGHPVTVACAGKTFHLGRTRANGHVQGILHIPVRLGTQEPEAWIPFTVKTKGSTGEGQSLLIEDTGLSVISDIDDTIKETGIGHRREVLANTFLSEFKAVPGMASRFRAWAAQGAAFHYISGSPWALYPDVQRFLKTEKFPMGTLHLRHFRWKDRSVLNLFCSPQRFKQPLLQEFFRRYPGRRFILVGDSGENDLQLYRELATRHPGQVKAIYIRELAGPKPVLKRIQ